MRTPTTEADLSESNARETTPNASQNALSLDSGSTEQDSQFSEDISLQIRRAVEQLIDQLAVGDFHSRWDAAKQFAAKFSEMRSSRTQPYRRRSPQKAWPRDRVLPILIQNLQDQQNPDVQWFLVRILSQFEHPDTVAALAKLLGQTTSETLQQAVSKALSGMGAIAIESLTVLLSDQATTNADQRILAARTLSHIRQGAVIAPLLGVVDDPNAKLRVIALEALGSFHDPRITPVLLNALNDHASICIEALRTLGRRRDLLPTTDLVSPLQRCLASDNEAIACESAMALGRLGSDSAVEALGKSLDKPLPTSVKRVIAEALGWLNRPAAVAYLAQSFRRSEPYTTAGLRQAIARALGQTRDAICQHQAASPLIDWLTAHHLESDSAASSPQQTALMQSVLSALARLGVPTALKGIVPILAHGDPRIRMHALSALKQIDPRTAQQSTQRYLQESDLSASTKQRVQETLLSW